MNKVLPIIAVCIVLFATIFAIIHTTEASTCPYLSKPVVYGQRSVDVLKLQVFLIGEGIEIPAGATGFYGTQTRAAVNEFQLKYAFQILFPLKLTAPTGNVYSMTLAQINAIQCGI